MPKFILQHTNAHKEKFYFVKLGDEWPGRPGLFLIAKTTPKIERAKRFDTALEAGEVLVKADNPIGWEIIILDKDGNKA